MDILEKRIYPRSGDKQTIYLKPVISNPNISIGDYTMYNDFVNDPLLFEKNNVLYHYPINKDKLMIGKFCSIGPNVVIGLGNHPTRNFVSTSPKLFLKGEFIKEDKYNQFPTVTIGNDVWIGANVTVINGITIGDGAVIGANSIVVTDIPAYSIYGGVPAKYIRKRFEQEQVDFLLKLKWWDMGDEWIKNNSHLFSDINSLMEKYGISF